MSAAGICLSGLCGATCIAYSNSQAALVLALGLFQSAGQKGGLADDVDTREIQSGVGGPIDDARAGPGAARSVVKRPGMRRHAQKTRLTATTSMRSGLPSARRAAPPRRRGSASSGFQFTKWKPCRRPPSSFSIDSSRNQEDWLNQKVASKFSRKENTAFLSGNGVGQPRGILDYAFGSSVDYAAAQTTPGIPAGWGTLSYTASGTSGSFGTGANGANKLIDLVHSIPSAYHPGAAFMMHRTTMAQVRKLKDDAGQFIWQNSMVAGQPPQLLGFSVYEASDVPTIAATRYSVLFGNFRAGYQIVDRQGVRVLRDPFTSKPFVLFYSTKRVGGDVKNFQAIAALKFSAT